MAKRDKAKKPPKRKLFWFIFIFAAIIAIFFFSTKLYLAINLLLGNDIVIKMSPDRESLSLVHGQSEQINFDSYILTNPFCSAECISEFTSLSSNQMIESDAFNMTPAIVKSKKYLISSPAIGEGQNYYRFSIKCRGISTFLCHTSGENKTETALLAVSYGLNDEEQNQKNYSKRLISEMIQESNSLDSEIKSISLTLGRITSIDKSYFSDELKTVSDMNAEFNDSAFNLKKEWENQQYDLFPPENVAYELVPFEFDTRLTALNSALRENISVYNSLIDSLNISRQNLERLNYLNLSNESLIKRDEAIASFNSAINSFNNISSVKQKKDIALNISVPNLSNEENASIPPVLPIKDIPAKIEPVETQYSPVEITFIEPYPQCCLFGKCGACCTGCENINYPLILLHGHAFNKKISAEYSLETFQSMQKKLETDGYLDAGSVLISPTQEGIWAQINSPLALRASYYFDVYKNPEESSIIETKSDSLDTYALRLKDIIAITKYKTGKNKVIIIAHSMGGLVARRYIQIFGDNDIEKLILIGTPNHGIESNIQKLCSLIGESLECRDMSAGSLFINKLNYAETPSIQVYNIIGIGCQMGNETGDGIVTKSSAYLESAHNYEINGTCDELTLNFLHNDMIDPEKFPEVYKIVSESLEK